MGWLPNRHRADRDMPVEEWPVNRIYCQLADDIGTRLWVRETFAECGGRVVYRADYSDGFYPGANFQPWRSPLAMPRRLSRITVVNESVRVQRGQDISDTDAEAEGVLLWAETDPGLRRMHAMGIAVPTRPRFLYRLMRQKLWDANDWVFALTFKRAKGK